MLNEMRPQSQHLWQTGEVVVTTNSGVELKTYSTYIDSRSIGVIIARGKIGGASLSQFTQELKFISEKGPQEIILDLCDVTLISSGGIRQILQSCIDLNHRLIIVDPSEQAQKTIQISGSQDSFSVFPSLSEALLTLKTRSSIH